MNQTRQLLQPLLTCATLTWVGGAFADALTITFSSNATPAPTALPISPWLVVAIAVAIALVALALFRRKGTQRFFILGAGLLIAGGGMIVEKNVLALVPATPLVTSPYTEIIACDTSLNQAFTSGTGGSITLTAVTDTGGSSTLTAGTTCAASTILTPATTCQVVTTTAGC